MLSGLARDGSARDRRGKMASESDGVELKDNTAADITQSYGKRTPSKNLSDNESEMMSKVLRQNSDLPGDNSDLEGLPSTAEAERLVDRRNLNICSDNVISDTEYSLPATREVEKRLNANVQYELFDVDCPLSSTAEINNRLDSRPQKKQTSAGLNSSQRNLNSANLEISKNIFTNSMNLTVASENQRRIIIMKEGQGVDSNLDQVHRHSLFDRPESFAKLIQESCFSKLPIKDIRVNYKSKLAAIELTKSIDELEQELLNRILNMTSIGNYTISCYIPNRDWYRCGVVSPIGPDLNLNDIMVEINKHSATKVAKIERLLKHKADGTFEPSLSIRLFFEGNQLPSRIRVGYQQFVIRPYVYVPTQCYRCQRLWHTANSCKARVRCQKCGESHNIAVCPSSIEHCANCRGSHRANSKQCKIIADAYKVEKLRADGLNFNEAREKIQQNNSVAYVGNDPSLSISSTSNIRQMNVRSSSQRNISYSDVVNNLQRKGQWPVNGENINPQATTLRDQGMQTDPVEQHRDITIIPSSSGNLQDFQLSKAFLLKLIDTLVETYDRAVINESKGIRRNVIYSCFKNNFKELPVMNVMSVNEQMEVSGNETDDSGTSEDNDNKTEGSSNKPSKMMNPTHRKVTSVTLDKQIKQSQRQSALGKSKKKPHRKK